MKLQNLIWLLVWVPSWNHAQSVLPYDLSWDPLPFAGAYSKAQKLTATTFQGKRNLKKQVSCTTEEIYFNEQGKAIQEKKNFYEKEGEYCWMYADDGCPAPIHCTTDSNGTELPYDFTCHSGQIDTIFGNQGLLKVLHYDETGRRTSTVDYKKNKSTGTFEFVDSIQAKYDEQGRYAGFVGPDYWMVVRYLQDSIVIERYHHGILKSTREIKCGRYGLPVLMQTWVYSERRNRKKSLWLYSTLEYEFRE